MLKLPLFTLLLVVVPRLGVFAGQCNKSSMFDNAADTNGDACDVDDDCMGSRTCCTSCKTSGKCKDRDGDKCFENSDCFFDPKTCVLTSSGGSTDSPAGGDSTSTSTTTTTPSSLRGTPRMVDDGKGNMIDCNDRFYSGRKVCDEASSGGIGGVVAAVVVVFILFVAGWFYWQHSIKKGKALARRKQLGLPASATDAQCVAAEQKKRRERLGLSQNATEVQCQAAERVLRARAIGLPDNSSEKAVSGREQRREYHLRDDASDHELRQAKAKRIADKKASKAASKARIDAQKAENKKKQEKRTAAHKKKLQAIKDDTAGKIQALQAKSAARHAKHEEQLRSRRDAKNAERAAAKAKRAGGKPLDKNQSAIKLQSAFRGKQARSHIAERQSARDSGYSPNGTYTIEILGHSPNLIYTNSSGGRINMGDTDLDPNHLINLKGSYGITDTNILYNATKCPEPPGVGTRGFTFIGGKYGADRERHPFYKGRLITGFRPNGPTPEFLGMGWARVQNKKGGAQESTYARKQRHKDEEDNYMKGILNLGGATYILDGRVVNDRVARDCPFYNEKAPTAERLEVYNKPGAGYEILNPLIRGQGTAGKQMKINGVWITVRDTDREIEYDEFGRVAKGKVIGKSTMTHLYYRGKDLGKCNHITKFGNESPGEWAGSSQDDGSLWYRGRCIKNVGSSWKQLQVLKGTYATTKQKHFYEGKLFSEENGSLTYLGKGWVRLGRAPNKYYCSGRERTAEEFKKSGCDIYEREVNDEGSIKSGSRFLFDYVVIGSQMMYNSATLNPPCPAGGFENKTLGYGLYTPNDKTGVLYYKGNKISMQHDNIRDVELIVNNGRGNSGPGDCYCLVEWGGVLSAKRYSMCFYKGKRLCENEKMKNRDGMHDKFIVLGSGWAKMEANPNPNKNRSIYYYNGNKAKGYNCQYYENDDGIKRKLALGRDAQRQLAYEQKFGLDNNDVR